MLGCRQAVRQWLLEPPFAGSNPATPANGKLERKKCNQDEIN